MSFCVLQPSNLYLIRRHLSRLSYHLMSLEFKLFLSLATFAFFCLIRPLCISASLFIQQCVCCRFVVEGSVEQRILQLQEKKLNLANDVLTGSKRTGANKLSFDDLKML